MLARSRYLRFVGIGCWAVLVAGAVPQAQGAGIGINIGSDVNASAAVGSNLAGVVALGNWNDVPIAQQTNLALKDSTGAIVPGLTLSTIETYEVPASAVGAGGVNFSNAGSSSLMRGHVYHLAAPIDLVFTGAIPYSNYDIYVYYNSGAVANSQIFQILDSAGTSLGLQQAGSETPGGDTSFVLSDGLGNNANYVKFSGLTSSSVPTNFIIRATVEDFSYAYLNGVQIVAAGTMGGVDGDLNGDFMVDTADYTIFKSNYLQTVTPGTNGDFNSDGTVEIDDFLDFRGFYEAFNGGGSAASLPPVPEPSSIVLALVAASLWGIRRSRSNRAS
jgi:hypothetical protein